MRQQALYDADMLLTNVTAAKSWFQVLQTTAKSQTATMLLAPGHSSEDELSTHPHSDQILLVLDGAVEAEVGKESATLTKGDVILIPANTPHRFSNHSAAPVLTFNVYASPAYPPNEAG